MGQARSRLRFEKVRGRGLCFCFCFKERLFNPVDLQGTVGTWEGQGSKLAFSIKAEDTSTLMVLSSRREQITPTRCFIGDWRLAIGDWRLWSIGARADLPPIMTLIGCSNRYVYLRMTAIVVLISRKGVIEVVELKLTSRRSVNCSGVESTRAENRRV